MYIFSNVIRNYSTFFKLIFILLFATLLANTKGNAQDKTNTIHELDVIHSPATAPKNNTWIQFTDAPNSLYYYLAAQAGQMLTKREASIAHLHTLNDWQQRQRQVRKTLMDITGPFPGKTPLHAEITRKIEKSNYRIEHIVYESQPGFYVTSSLFIPAKLKGKAPAIIYCSGHSENGYRYESYQHAILNLVKKGFIVFAFDPVGQGERLEYFDPTTGKPVFEGSDWAHSYSGAQAFIAGSSQARYMIWDGIRAVDYLLTRKEVDPERIGITGRSGGGTQSAYIAAFDDRIYAAAPENYITNFNRLIQSIGPQDGEQNLFNEIARGIDHADLLEVRAPKPTLMITTTRDEFSIQGARETAKEVSRIYKAYNREASFGKVEDDAPHESTLKNREAMYAFFQKNLNNPGDSADEETELLSNEELQVTKTGQVSTSYQGETVFSLNRKDADKLINKLDVSRKNIVNHLSDVLKSARKLSGYHEPTQFHEPVFTGRFARDGYVIEKYFVKGEGDYVIPYLLVIPDNPNNKALMYLHPDGKAVEAMPGGEMEWFARKGFTVLAPDLIGTGEMGPGDFHGDSYIDSISYNVWFCSMLIDKSITGIRAGDVARLVTLLKKNTEITTVFGIAKKEMAPVLLHAAAFDRAISRVALIEPYISYRSVVMNRFYNPAFVHSTVPGALTAYDLPDLAASLAPRKLVLASVTDGSGKAADLESINKDFTIIKEAYQNKNAERQLHIAPLKTSENPYDIYMELIK